MKNAGSGGLKMNPSSQKLFKFLEVKVIRGSFSPNSFGSQFIWLVGKGPNIWPDVSLYPDPSIASYPDPTGDLRGSKFMCVVASFPFQF